MNTASSTHYINLLTKGLMRHFRIKNDNSLVFLIGQGHERSNEAALRSWVGSKVGNGSFAPERNLFDNLTEDLTRELADLFPDETEQLADLVVSHIPVSPTDVNPSPPRGCRVLEFKPRESR